MLIRTGLPEISSSHRWAPRSQLCGRFLISNILRFNLISVKIFRTMDFLVGSKIMTFYLFRYWTSGIQNWSNPISINNLFHKCQCPCSCLSLSVCLSDRCATIERPFRNRTRKCTWTFNDPDFESRKSVKSLIRYPTYRTLPLKFRYHIQSNIVHHGYRSDYPPLRKFNMGKWFLRCFLGLRCKPNSKKCIFWTRKKVIRTTMHCNW
jgi:hypothetical protein